MNMQSQPQCHQWTAISRPSPEWNSIYSKRPVLRALNGDCSKSIPPVSQPGGLPLQDYVLSKTLSTWRDLCPRSLKNICAISCPVSTEWVAIVGPSSEYTELKNSVLAWVSPINLNEFCPDKWQWWVSPQLSWPVTTPSITVHIFGTYHWINTIATLPMQVTQPTC